MKSFETLAPRAIATIESDVRVYDLGQNASIVPRLRVRGSAGAVVKILPAELIATDGRADQVSVGGTAKNEVCWTYLLSGDEQGETWSPQFTYHGARYLEVRLSPGADGVLPKVDELVGLVVHSDSDPAGEFACSNDLFNRTYQMVRWAQRSNMAHVLTDCPHRERLGWLEQTHLNGPALRYEFDLARLFSKTFRDMADAQQVTGLVPAIAPEYVRFDGGFWDSPEWGSAIVLAAWQHWEWTADDRPLREHYGAMQRYVDYLGRKATGHILSHGLGDWYDLGPNAPGNAQLTPVALTATAIYCETVRTLAKIAAHLGRADDERAYRSLAEQIAQAFNQKFWNAESGVYSTGSQTSLALPLVLGLAPVERVASLREALVADVRAHANGLTSGDVGYRYLLLALAEAGRSDVIFDLNTQTDRPGYGYQLSHGATSLPESWTAERKSSQNHFMLGQINEWFYGWLAGLAPDPAAPGFKKSILRPQPVAGVDWARARHATPYGELAIHWRKDISTGASGPRAEVKEQGRAPRFLVHATVPANTEATLYLPCGDAASVFELGRPVAEAIGVAARGRENGCAVFLLKAGSYEFEVRM